MTISQVLAQAAKLVERGWCRGFGRVYQLGRPIARCAFVAIADAGEMEDFCVTEFFQTFLGINTRLGPWNDARGRTGPEVACWLSSAAEYAKMLGK